jgi:hypothetical protein
MRMCILFCASRGLSLLLSPLLSPLSMPSVEVRTEYRPNIPAYLKYLYTLKPVCEARVSTRFFAPVEVTCLTMERRIANVFMKRIPERRHCAFERRKRKQGRAGRAPFFRPDESLLLCFRS